MFIAWFVSWVFGLRMVLCCVTNLCHTEQLALFELHFRTPGFRR